MTFLEQLKADHGRKLMIGGHRGHLSEVRENTIENYKQILAAASAISRSISSSPRTMWL